MSIFFRCQPCSFAYFLHPLAILFQLERRLTVKVMILAGLSAECVFYKQNALPFRFGKRGDDASSVGRYLEVSLEKLFSAFDIGYDDGAFGRPAGVVDGNERQSAILCVVYENTDGSSGIMQIAVGTFFRVVVIYDGVREDWPTVAQIPPDDAGFVLEFVATPKLQEVFHGLALHALRGVDEIFEFLGHIFEYVLHLVCHQPVAVVGLSQNRI